MFVVQAGGPSGPPTFFWSVGKGLCPECGELGKPCCACMGRVCKNGHLSVKSKYFSPCPRHDVLAIANKTFCQKLYENLMPRNTKIYSEVVKSD